MKYTVIRSGNNVFQYNSLSYIEREFKDDYIVVNSLGEVIKRKGKDPIVWPVPPVVGLQAIIDVKKCILRFGHDEMIGLMEYVISTYVDSGTVKKPEMKEFTSIEDAQPAPHIFDIINYWPHSDKQCLGTKDLPDGWKWSWNPGMDDWILGNGTIVLTRNDWDKYDNKKSHAQPTPATREEVMALVDVWPTGLDTPSEKLIAYGWIWAVLGGSPVIINQTKNINSGTVITESEWREYLVQVLRKNPAIETVTAASMLQAALGHMEDRAKTYDAPGGERSMGKTVSAFNTITGLTLSEEQGWLFMEILKQVRSQQGNYRADNYEDMVAYAALRGECAARERGDK